MNMLNNINAAIPNKMLNPFKKSFKGLFSKFKFLLLTNILTWLK
jgi:hypothetical protein